MLRSFRDTLVWNVLVRPILIAIPFALFFDFMTSGKHDFRGDRAERGRMG